MNEPDRKNDAHQKDGTSDTASHKTDGQKKAVQDWAALE